MTALRLTDVVMDFPQVGGERLRVLDSVSLTVASGEFYSMVGPSGCGKTTLLDLVMGLAVPTSGSVEVEARRKAMVFQRPQLLPWRTVLGNALYGMECGGQLDGDAEPRALALLQRMGLSQHVHEHPHRLSEGMKQRVNLARALLTEPDLLLMDEPFAALDPATRRRLQDDLLELWHERGFTVIFVSHSLAEVAYLADSIAVLSDKPTRVCGVAKVGLPRPRAATPQAELALLQHAEDLTRRYFATSV
ncbi:MAG: ABC transporter ATP-binding protein [Nannocystaceae bacterium]|nr:ABC transporter ATP-binding protein [Nannocystaceae bacterium]